MVFTLNPFGKRKDSPLNCAYFILSKIPNLSAVSMKSVSYYGKFSKSSSGKNRLSTSFVKKGKKKGRIR